MSSVAMAHDVKSMDAPKGRSNTLRVSEPGDAYEREADQAASEVISGMGRAAAWSLSRLTMHAPLQRECTCGGECDDCKKENKLQREANGNAAPAVAPAVVHAVLRGPGRQMEPGTRSFMESRFGYDFSCVRSGSKVGGQHTVEQNVLKVAAKNGGVIVLEGRNVVTGKIETIEVPAANYNQKF
jgi:hypothetical protein